MNRELGGDFDLAAFRHRAFYNAADHRIEMHLESVKPQTVTVAGRSLRRQGRDDPRQNSYNYTGEVVLRACARALAGARSRPGPTRTIISPCMR